MNNKLWVDDVRTPPDDTWDWATSFHAAIHMLEITEYSVVSLDHDLGSFYGSREMTGYDIMLWLSERKVVGTYHVPSVIKVHSANPVGVDNINSLIERYWNK